MVKHHLEMENCEYLSLILYQNCLIVDKQLFVYILQFDAISIFMAQAQRTQILSFDYFYILNSYLAYLLVFNEGFQYFKKCFKVSN